MMFPDFNEFCRQASDANLIPIWITVPADLLTPISAYLHLTRDLARIKSKDHFSFLLESVEGGENVARYTYMGTDPFLILCYRIPRDLSKNTAGAPTAVGTAEIAERSRRGDGYRIRRVEGDIAEVARGLIELFRPYNAEGLPPFSAGAVGYMTYDLITLREPVPLPPPNSSRAGLGKMPEAILMFFST